jgi:hypothetical protein
MVADMADLGSQVTEPTTFAIIPHECPGRLVVEIKQFDSAANESFQGVGLHDRGSER